MELRWIALLLAAPTHALLHGFGCRPATLPQSARRVACRPRLALDLLGDREEPLPPSEAVVAAVESAYQRQPEGTKLTAADLAAQGGLSIDDARVGLKELASALAGAEGVSVSASSKGDLLYGFPPDVRKELATLSNAAKLRDAWNSAKPALQTVGRVSFGLALFASIAVIFTGITVLTSGGDEREERRDDRGGGMMGGGFGMGNFGFRIFLDLLFPPFPYGFYGYGWFSPPPRMSLPEAIFSFVFGDGDPNVALRAARVRATAEAIRANGGALTADALAPFLDPPGAPGAADDSTLVDESWVLPAVTELGGRPEVTDDGTIVYLFEELAVSALASDAARVLADPALNGLDALGAAELADLAEERAIVTSGADSGALRDALRSWGDDQLAELASSGGRLFPDGYVEERRAPFSNAEGGQLFAAGALGLVNLGGAAYLGNLLAQIPPGVRLPAELGALQAGFPFLLAYALAYVAIPAVRYVRLQAANAAVDERNANRRAWAEALRRPGAALSKRLEAAGRARKGVRLVREDDVDFDSSRSLAEQAETPSVDFDDFDKRLRERSG